MTNAEKFRTALERRNAYQEYVRKSGDVVGKFGWLELEYKEELLPCPFCGSTPVMANNMESMKSLSYYVKCVCGARFASALSTSAAAEMWNKRVK